MKTTVKERIITELLVLWENKYLLLIEVFIMCYGVSLFTRALALYLHVPAKERLWDLGFQIFPESDKLFLNDFFQWFLWSSMAVVYILPMIFPKFHRKGVYGGIVFFEVFTTLMVVHIFRAITYHLTRIPSPSWRCMSDPNLEVPQSMHGEVFSIFSSKKRNLEFVIFSPIIL